MNPWRITDAMIPALKRLIPGHLLAILLLTSALAGARAQVPMQQTGRLFDRNPQVGSGGYNYARPLSPLIPGNTIATGNVRGGMALRGYSPIGDPTSFRAGLGTSTLGAFRRDSVSVADYGSVYGSSLTTPYYDPSRTVPTVGFLSGQYGQATPRIGPLPSPGRSSTPLGVPGPLDLRVGAALGTDRGVSQRDSDPLRAQIVGLSPGQSPELSSSIFGPLPSTMMPSMRLDQNLTTGLSQLPEVSERSSTLLAPYQTPRLDEPLGSRPPLGTPLEYIRSRETSRVTGPEQTDPFAAQPSDEADLVPGPLGAVPPESAAAPAPTRETLLPGDLRLRDISVLPGYDVFTDMQLARTLEADPSAGWWEQMQAVIRTEPAAAAILDEQATLQAQEFIEQVRNSPIRTFHGAGPSVMNDELLKAESLLEIGQYFEAVRRYDVAHRQNPLNPLPLIGKGNALLAAGEYLSAVVALVQGFERYPEMTEFAFDLQALMGGGEIVDIRRADLMDRLRSREDPQLRFLLGYLEYYSGNQESAMQNFEKAAANDPSGSIISRFPEMLRREMRLPPPKLPPADSPLPDGTPPRLRDASERGPDGAPRAPLKRTQRKEP
ncbi:MAG: hypothetical protein ABIG44_16155 [Planctomycetota bacterium]